MSRVVTALLLTAFSELYTAFGNAGTVPLDGGWLNGVSYSAGEQLAFDIGGDVGLYQATRKFTLFVGITFVPNGRHRIPQSHAPVQGNQVPIRSL